MGRVHAVKTNSSRYYVQLLDFWVAVCRTCTWQVQVPTCRDLPW